jgi:hypothetical protein
MQIKRLPSAVSTRAYLLGAAALFMPEVYFVRTNLLNSLMPCRVIAWQLRSFKLTVRSGAQPESPLHNRLSRRTFDAECSQHVAARQSWQIFCKLELSPEDAVHGMSLSVQ